MHRTSALAPLPALVLLILGGLSAPAWADPIELVAADDRGVTLRFTLPAWSLEPGEGGSFDLAAPGLQVLDVPGRPLLPFAGTLIALPPGSQAAAHLIDAGPEEERAGVRLAIGGRPVFHPDPAGLGLVPGREPVTPVADGPWPTSPVEVGQPF